MEQTNVLANNTQEIAPATPVLPSSSERFAIAATFQSVFRNSTKSTHPDTRSQFFSQQELYPSLDAIYKAMLGIDELVKEDSEYNQSAAETMFSQLVKGVTDLDKGEERLRIHEQKQQQDAQRLALEAIPQIVGYLEQLVLEVQGLRSDIANLNERLPKSND